MQNSQTPFGMEAMHNVTGHSVNNSKQELENPNPNGFGNASFCDIPNLFSSFMSPTNSSSSTFNTANADNVDKISSVVGMLKGTLERKKLTNPTERGIAEDSSLGHYCAQEVLGETCLNQGQGNYFIHETPRMFEDPGVLLSINGSLVMEFEGFVTPPNPMQMNMLSHETSQSESSAATLVVSAGFEACDGPSNSGQTMSESSRKRLGNGKSSEIGSIHKGDYKKQLEVFNS